MNDEEKGDAFVRDLTELTLKYGVAIQEGTLFMIEQEDRDTEYRIDADSRLLFG